MIDTIKRLFFSEKYENRSEEISDEKKPGLEESIKELEDWDFFDFKVITTAVKYYFGLTDLISFILHIHDRPGKEIEYEIECDFDNLRTVSKDVDGVCHVIENWLYIKRNLHSIIRDRFYTEISFLNITYYLLETKEGRTYEWKSWGRIDPNEFKNETTEDIVRRLEMYKTCWNWVNGDENGINSYKIKEIEDEISKLNSRKKHIIKQIDGLNIEISNLNNEILTLTDRISNFKIEQDDKQN